MQNPIFSNILNKTFINKYYCMRGKTHKSKNEEKKKKSTLSKSSIDEEIPTIEMGKINIAFNKDLDLKEEEENMMIDLSIKPQLETKTKTRKSKKSFFLVNNQVEVNLNEKENKNVNLTTNSNERTTNNSVRKISEITDISLAESNLTIEYKPIFNSKVCSLSPNANSNMFPFSTRESLNEIKTDRLNFSEFKIEEINLENKKSFDRVNSQSGKKIIKSLSFSEEIKKTLCYSLRHYSQDDIDNLFNLERSLYEEEQNLISSRNPIYFVNHPNLNPRMRSILIDWIMEVCAQLNFMRSTFHSSIVLIDIFLSKYENLPTHLLQLTGITCLIIAAKNEEIVIPSFEAFSHSTDNAYSVPKILDFERLVLNVLQWRIHFPNLAFWSNLITDKWDNYAAEFSNRHSFDFSNQIRRNLILPKFRGKTDEDIFLFKNFFQLIDLISIDFDSLKYSQKFIVASVIYILIGLYFRCFTISDVVNKFTRNVYACSNYFELNAIFNRFTSNYLYVELNELGDHITYVSFFFHMKFQYDPPNIYLDKEGLERNKSYENYLQIQTHNPYNTKSIEYILNIKNTIMKQ